MFQNSRTLDILLERFQCTPLGPKLIFWVFSHHFGALKRPFGFAPHTLRLKLVFWMISRPFIAAPGPLWKSVSGAFNARVYASETISCFVSTNMPNPLFQSKTHVLGVPWPHLTRCNNLYRGAFNARVYASRTISCFFAANMPFPILWVWNSSFGCFPAILLPHLTRCKN